MRGAESISPTDSTQRQFHDLLTTAGFKINRTAKFRYGIWGFTIAEAILPEG